MGWDTTDIERAMLEDAIWRIPSFALTISFADRKDSKKFAEAIAQKIAK